MPRWRRSCRSQRSCRHSFHTARLRAQQRWTHRWSMYASHATRNIQPTSYSMKHATYNTQRTTCNIRHMTWNNTQCATCTTQHATRITQHTTRNIQHATYNTQHATRNIQHATCIPRSMPRAALQHSVATCSVAGSDGLVHVGDSPRRARALGSTRAQ